VGAVSRRSQTSNAAPTGSPARDPLAFLPGVTEQLGYYVYALIDPRDNRIFYVGKGTGDRVYQHARYAKKVGPESRAELKLGLIQEIHRAGLDVRVELIRHRLSEETAFEVEAAVLDTLELAGLELTNLVAGQGIARAWRPLADIVAGYAATPIEIAHEHRVLLIRVSREYRHGITSEELYDKTRQWWKVNPHRQPDYAFSVFDGIVRAVYRIEEWEPVLPEEQVGRMKGRWRFDGVRDPEMEERYVWKNVSSYLRAGAQNPIKYVNC
jgi:hypothetical protein